MAVELAERAIDAVSALLLAQMATELSAIDTARTGDSVVMLAPVAAGYYKRPKSELAGKGPWVEVYEGSIDLSATQFTDPTAGRVTYDIPITIRVTWKNADADSVDTMMKRMRRYAAAVVIVISKYYDLNDSDDATKFVGNVSVTPPWETLGEDEDGVLKGQVEIGVTVRCEEIV